MGRGGEGNQGVGKSGRSLRYGKVVSMDLRVEKIAGIQSTNEIRTGIVSNGASGGGLACADKVAASINRKYAAANYMIIV